MPHVCPSTLFVVSILLLPHALAKELPPAMDDGTPPRSTTAHHQPGFDDDEYSMRLRDHGITPSAAGIAVFLKSLRPDEAEARRTEEYIEQLGSEDFVSRQAATREISNLPNPPLRKLRKLAADSPDTEVRFRAKRILGRIEQGLADSVLVAALLTIQERRIPGLLPALLPLIKSWDHETLLDAARQAAVATATEHDLTLLRSSLLDAEQPFAVRIASLDAILHLKKEKGLEVATPLLDDASEQVRYAAAMRFGDRGRLESIRVLLDLLESDHAELRDGADRALRALTGRRPRLVLESPPSPRQLAKSWTVLIEADQFEGLRNYPVDQVVLLNSVLELGGNVQLSGEDRRIRAPSDLRPGPVSILEIDLRRSKVNDQLLTRIMTLRNLESLDLTACGGISNDGLRKIRQMRSLRRLYLEETRISDPSLAILFQLPALEELRLGRLVTDAGLMHIHTRSQLRRLSLSYSRVTDLGLDWVARLQRLQGLRLYRCPGVSDAGLVHVAQLKGLSTLTLTCPKVTDDGLKSLIKLVRLEHLDLYTTQASSAGMRHVASLPALRKLNLSRTKIDDSATLHLARLKSLEHLDLSYTKISDEALEPLKELPKLTRLSLESTRVTGTGLVHLMRLSGLRSLRLYNTRLTDQGLASAGQLSHLTHLDIGNTSVTDDGLRHIGGMQYVTDLDISRSPVSDNGLKHLRGMARLAKLNRRRTRITESGIEMLRQAVPTLAEVR